jgi:histone-lysine N-methyltransferase SETMAR
MDQLLKSLRRARPDKAKSGNWFFPHDDAPFHSATIVKQFLAKKSVTLHYHPPYSPDLAPMDYFLFPKVQSNLMGRRFDVTLDILHNVTSELKSIPAAEFCGGFMAVPVGI